MRLPFTVEQFFGVFAAYNEAVWPAQAVLVLLALVALGALWAARPWSSRIIAGVLAFLWAWIGIAYHLAFFAAVNPLAYAFAALALATALALVWQGVVRQRLVFERRRGPRAVAGAVLVLFALLVYPAWSSLAGHHYPALPTFGLPCPTTIFTFGLLAFAAGTGLRAALAGPILWSAVGGQAAFLLGVPQDLGLVAAGFIGVALFARPPRMGVDVAVSGSDAPAAARPGSGTPHRA